MWFIAQNKSTHYLLAFTNRHKCFAFQKEEKAYFLKIFPYKTALRLDGLSLDNFFRYKALTILYGKGMVDETYYDHVLKET